MKFVYIVTKEAVKMEEAMDKLYYQTSENFADMLSPIIYHYLKGVVK